MAHTGHTCTFTQPKDPGKAWRPKQRSEAQIYIFGPSYSTLAAAPQTGDADRTYAIEIYRDGLR